MFPGAGRRETGRWESGLRRWGACCPPNLTEAEGLTPEVLHRQPGRTGQPGAPPVTSPCAARVSARSVHPAPLTDRPRAPGTQRGPRTWGFRCKNQERPRETGTTASPVITERFESDGDRVGEGKGAGGRVRVGVLRKSLASRTPESPGPRAALRALGTPGTRGGRGGGAGTAVASPPLTGVCAPRPPKGGSYKADTRSWRKAGGALR